LRPATLQKGLRKFIKKRAFGASNAEDLWASLTEACAEDGVKDWEGKNPGCVEANEGVVPREIIPNTESQCKQQRTSYLRADLLSWD
ncbi:hypothetical protein OESDEN_10147, partial [Oesophagostomum dentatum]